MTDADRRLAAIATGQLAGFSRRQAHDAGVSDRQLRRRVQSGVLIQTGPHSFRSAMAPSTPLVELHDRLLDIGGEVWATGPTAAALYGFDGYTLRRPFHVLVPRQRHLSRRDIRLHRSDRIELIDVGTVDGIAVTSPARTIIEIARVAGREALARCLDSALRDGRLSEDLMHRRLVALRSRGRHGLPTLLEVLTGRDATRGGHSWLEREYLRLLASAALPRPTTQQVIARTDGRMVRVDCHFPGTPVVVELLGYTFHRTRAQMTADANRYNAMLAAGCLPYQFTYEQVAGTPDDVVDQTARALRLPTAA